MLPYFSNIFLFLKAKGQVDTSKKDGHQAEISTTN